jgi:putative hydroxymethylpyrimidine transport system substrate-binding protein
MMFKLKLAKLINIFLLSLLPLLAGAEGFKPLTVILDWYVNPDHAPLFIAQQQGFFAKEGLVVKLIGPADPVDPPKLVAAGKADLAITYQPQLVLQVERGLPLVRIATLIATPLSCLVVRADSPIHSLADLKGKRIGYSTSGMDSTTLTTMLQHAGLTTQDVELINVRYNLTQALLTKKVDAINGMMRNFELAQLQQAGIPGRAFFPEENGMPSYDELVIVAQRDALKDPRLPAFLRALEQGVQYLINHPEQTWEQFAKAHPELDNDLNKQAWFATLPRFALRPAALDQGRYEKLAAFLQQEKLIKKVPKVASYAVELAR